MRVIEEYLRRENFPRRLTDEMMSRPSNDVYWVTSDDLLRIGEYAPDVEEALIARCGYDKRMYADHAHRFSRTQRKKIEECAAFFWVENNAAIEESILDKPKRWSAAMGFWPEKSVKSLFATAS